MENKLQKAPENKFDIIATVTALTAKNIVQSYENIPVREKSIFERII